MAIDARVRVWDDEEGWGVVDAPEIPGGCWVHFSAVDMQGYRSLRGVDTVELEYREVPQDGYRFSAVRVRVPGQPSGAPPTSAADGAYTSTLTLEFDDGRVVRFGGQGNAAEELEPPAG